MLIDSHCHLDFPDFNGEHDALVERARAAGVARIVSISTRIRQFENLRSIVEKYDDVFCSVGTHPYHAAEERDFTAEQIIALTKHPKVVAIGEAGLDNHWPEGDPQAQAHGFRAHIAAALPHDRVLVETDAPYLAPGKFRGKRNEPSYVGETAKVLAEVQGVSFEEVSRQTTENFFRLFSKVPRPAKAAA